MTIETVSTPVGWTKIGLDTQDFLYQSEQVSAVSKVTGSSIYFQSMFQSGTLAPPEYEKTRWYLFVFSRSSNGNTDPEALFAKDAVDQPYFPVYFPESTSTGGGTTPAQPSVTAVQQALNAHYNAKLTVDNKWGPNTCKAAFAFQKNVVGVTGKELTAAFFTKLGLPETWVTTFKSACASYYSSGVTPPVPPVPPVPPTPSTFPWLSTLVGAAGGSLIGLAGKKTVLKKKARVKTWHAAVGGALLGALGGFFVGKARQ